MRISTNGVDFGYRALTLGSTASVRAAGTLLFPRELPVVQGEPWVEWRLQRLGLLANW